MPPVARQPLISARVNGVSHYLDKQSGVPLEAIASQSENLLTLPCAEREPPSLFVSIVGSDMRGNQATEEPNVSWTRTFCMSQLALAILAKSPRQAYA